MLPPVSPVENSIYSFSPSTVDADHDLITNAIPVTLPSMPLCPIATSCSIPISFPLPLTLPVSLPLTLPVCSELPPTDLHAPFATLQLPADVDLQFVTHLVDPQLMECDELSKVDRELKDRFCGDQQLFEHIRDILHKEIIELSTLYQSKLQQLSVLQLQMNVTLNHVNNHVTANEHDLLLEAHSPSQLDHDLTEISKLGQEIDVFQQVCIEPIYEDGNGVQLSLNALREAEMLAVINENNLLLDEIDKLSAIIDHNQQQQSLNTQFAEKHHEIDEERESRKHGEQRKFACGHGMHVDEETALSESLKAIQDKEHELKKLVHEWTQLQYANIGKQQLLEQAAFGLP